MKLKKILLAGMVTMMFIPAFSQKKIDVKDGKVDYKSFVGSQSSIIVNVPYTTLDAATKALKRELKDWHGKLKRKGSDYFLDNGSLKEMGDNTFDVYAMAFEGSDKEIFIAVAVDLGGAYLNQNMHPKRYKVIKNKMYNLARRFAHDGLSSQIDAANDLLSTQQKTLKDLVKQKESDENKIAEDQKEIKDLQEKIKTNVSNQGTQNEKIQKQQGVVKSLQDLAKDYK